MDYTGENLKSEAMANELAESDSMDSEESRKFIFNNTFVIFMKEEEAELPHMSLYVDNAI